MIAVGRAYAVTVLALSGLALVAVMVVNVAYSKHVQEQADRRWCSLLASLDTNDPPATTERGRVVQRQLHQLRLDLDCISKGP